MKIGFIGLGRLGLPCATVIAKKGYDITGYDINNIKSNIITIKNSIKETVEDRDIVFVAVPTPSPADYDGKHPTSHLEPKPFEYHIVIDVLEEANMYMNKNQILVLISTVLPGSIKKIFAPLITNVELLYNPYLIALDTVSWDMVNPDMILIGAENTKKVKKLLNFYTQLCDNNPKIEIGTWEEIETIKLFYNTFISIKLSFINLMQDVAIKIGNINIDTVTEVLAKSNIIGSRYMTAGLGDGGACHLRDTIALKWLAKELNLGYDLFDTVIVAREVQAKNLAKELVKLAKENKLPILLNGISYKPKVPYVDGSYSLLVSHYCAEADYHCIQVDPLVSPQKGPFSAIVLLAHSELYCYLNEDSIIVDPWRKYKSNKYKVIHYGNTRK